MNEASYRSLFDSVADGMLIADSTGKILEANRQACSLLGRTREELLGAGWPEALGLFGEHLEEAFSGPGLGSFNVRLQFESATEPGGCVEASAVEYHEQTGEERVGVSLRALGGSVERVARPRRVAVDEEGLHNLLWRATEALALLDADGTIRYGNPAVLNVLGYELGELSGKRMLDLLHPEDARRVMRALSEDSKDVENQVTEEFRLLHADGSWRFFEGRVSKYLEDYEVDDFVLNCRDITERKQVENSLRRSLDVLLALREAGQTLGSTLEPDEICTRLLEIMKRISSLTTAVVSVPDAAGELRVWRAIGFESLWRQARYAPEAQSTLYSVLGTGERRKFTLQPPDPDEKPLVGLCLPLRWRSRVLGVLEIYGPESLQEEDKMGILDSLTGQAASALENARLYEKLSERERRLQELVGQLMSAQEEERRKVAYEVHDGLAQVAAAAHQHLQAFARFHSPESDEGREMLERAVELVWQTVGEARRVIADLRPTALDDFGLQTALRLELDSLRQRGWEIEYGGTLREDRRLPGSIETALFRIAQEALANVQKHANTRKVSLTMDHNVDHTGAEVHLSVRDWGSGFEVESLSQGGPGERVGVSSMKERANLFGGRFEILSHPSNGTAVKAEIQLPEWEGAKARGLDDLEVEGG